MAQISGGKRVFYPKVLKQRHEEDDFTAHATSAKQVCRVPWPVIGERHAFAELWRMVVTVAVAYTATVYPYTLCFLEFGLPEKLPRGDLVRGIATVLDAIFACDLVLNFFLAYTNRRGIEVVNPKKIVRRYLLTYFIFDLLALLPMEMFSPEAPKRDQNVNDSFRLARGARLTRLMQLLRLSRFLQLARRSRFLRGPGLTRGRGFFRQFRHLTEMRGVRIAKFALLLVIICHIMACGWFLVASLSVLHHAPVEESTVEEYMQATWVGRRATIHGQSLLDEPPLTQWLHCLYFIFTVFSTVGFGDMSAVTVPELVFVLFVMLFGAVAHSIIVSEMINVVTSIDGQEAAYCRKRGLLEAFREHSRIPEGSESFELLMQWLHFSKSSGTAYDRSEMRELLDSGLIPRDIMRNIPNDLYNGELLRSRFLVACGDVRGSVPPRLPLLLALHIQPRNYVAGEMVYRVQDHAFNLFLVQGGTFACIAMPRESGGLIESPALWKLPRRDVHKIAKGTGAALGGLRSTEKPDALLFPYKLYGRGSYFGASVFTGEPRRASVRCEAPNKKELLAIPKDELLRIAGEFPQYASAWRALARHEARARERRLAELRVAGVDYRLLACLEIQRWVRLKLSGAREPQAAGSCQKACAATSWDPIAASELGSAAWKLAHPAPSGDVQLRAQVETQHAEVLSALATLQCSHEAVLKALEQLKTRQEPLRSEGGADEATTLDI